MLSRQIVLNSFLPIMSVCFGLANCVELCNFSFALARQSEEEHKSETKESLSQQSLPFQTQPPQLSSRLSSLISLRPSVPISPTPPSHITPLITLQWEANPKEGKCQCLSDWSCCKSVAHWPLVHLQLCLCSWKSNKSDKLRCEVRPYLKFHWKNWVCV